MSPGLTSWHPLTWLLGSPPFNSEETGTHWTQVGHPSEGWGHQVEEEGLHTARRPQGPLRALRGVFNRKTSEFQTTRGWKGSVGSETRPEGVATRGEERRGPGGRRPGLATRGPSRLGQATIPKLTSSWSLAGGLTLEAGSWRGDWLRVSR